MTALSERLLAKYYANTPHPYKLFERAVEAIRKDSYTAYMVILVGALALILLVFALVTLF